MIWGKSERWIVKLFLQYPYEAKLLLGIGGGGGVERNLNSTLASIFNQKTEAEYKCIVACNDVPKIYCDYGKKLEILTVDTPIPTTHGEQCKDKEYKLYSIAQRGREILLKNSNPEDGIFFMPVDADDLVHTGIVQYVAEHFSENGFISKWGYVRYFSQGIYKKILKKEQWLFGFCGSCNIFKLRKEELPNDRGIFEQFDAERVNCIIYLNHGEVPGKFENNGKKFSILPFPSTIYMLDTGNNLSSIDPAYDINKGHKCFLTELAKLVTPHIHIGFLFNCIRNYRNYRIVDKEIVECFNYNI